LNKVCFSAPYQEEENFLNAANYKELRNEDQGSLSQVEGISKNSPNCSPPEGIKGRKTKNLSF
jgi:hypothetical protein